MSRPWKVLERVPTPDGLLELRRRAEPAAGKPADFLILLDGRIVMTSAEDRSEVALGELAGACPEGRTLVGGLGMGLTLRATLDATKPQAEIHVAELNPVIEAWCRGPLSALCEAALDDPRVRVEIGDVADSIAAAARDPAQRLDAILLDLYQGPPTRLSVGDPIFGRDALERCSRALTSGGLLAVWSETQSPAFAKELQKQGFHVEEQGVGRGRRHLIYVARKAKGRSK